MSNGLSAIRPRGGNCTTPSGKQPRRAGDTAAHQLVWMREMSVRR